MKSNLLIKLYILSVSVFLFNSIAFSQGASCAQADPFCTVNTYTFPNNTGQPSASTTNPGNDYGCLSSQPNPA
ncbi:MAG: hypothetical protein IT232_10380 [Flavobacteriales bacterium]|nr:hypothetical protein [Flavobacteriales bacterium]